MEYWAVQGWILVVSCCQAIAVYVDIGVQIPHSEPVSIYGDNDTNTMIRVRWICEEGSTMFRKAVQFYGHRSYKFDIFVSANSAGTSFLEVRKTHPVRSDECSVSDADRVYSGSFLHNTSHVIKTLKWNSLTVVTDTNNSFAADRLVDELSCHAIKTEVVFIQGGIDVMSQLANGTAMTNIRPRLRFLVVCSLLCIQNALRAAMDYDKQKGQGSLFRHFSYWLLVLDPRNRSFIEDMDVLLDHVAVINPPLGLNEHIIKLVKSVVNDSLSMCYEQKHQAVTDIMQQLQTIGPPTDVEMETLFWTEAGRRFSPVTDKTNINNIFPNGGYGLNGRQLTAGALEWLPFTRKLANNGSVVYAQACIDVLNYLSDVLNFSYIFKEPPDNQWGQPTTNDSELFTGLIGMLQRQETDITVALLGMSHERAPVVDFLPQIYAAYNGIIMKKQKADPLISSNLTDPFRWEVFVVGAAVFLGVVVLYMSTEYFNPYNYDTRVPCKQGHYHGTVDTVLVFYGAAIHQGTVHLPRSCSGRMLLSFWWLFVIVMTSTYSGNLIASLTVVKETLPYETLAQVLEDPQIQIGLWDGTVVQRSLQTSNSSELQAVWRKVLTSAEQDKRALSPNVTIHLERVVQGQYGYITDSTELAIFEQTLCDVFIVPQYILPSRYSMTLPKNSPLTDLFGNLILQITETGLLHHFIHKWMPKGGLCSPQPKGAQAIGMKQISAAFLATSIGVLCGIICLVIEMYLKWTKNRTKSTK